MTASPDQWHREARAALAGGKTDDAMSLAVQAVQEHPEHPELLNAAGDIHLKCGQAEKAAKYFERAVRHAPDRDDFAINHAIALGSAGRHHAAIAALKPLENQLASNPRYCSVRATEERAAGNPAAAAIWYDKCLALDPAHQRARHGRARVALERAESNALARFDHALAGKQDDGDLWLGKAQALDTLGRTDEAFEIAEALARQAPQWLEGLRFLAQLRLARGDADYASHYGAAMTAAPRDPAIVSDLATQLSAMDRHAQAADVAATAAHTFPDLPHFKLSEAVHAGAAGQQDRAEALFETLDLDTPERYLSEARHRMRAAEWDRADALLDRVIAASPWQGSAWAFRGIVWRVTQPGRAEWLNGQDGLTQMNPLEADAAMLREATDLLHRLHDASPLPLGQSLRGGTQTRGILYHRREPVLARLKDAVMATLETYRTGLPDADATHPLLRHRDSDWTLAGSWSVRLHGGTDFHVSHVHPQGLLSSALYLEVPEIDDAVNMPGWLELGRPPQDLHLDLEPLRTVKPQPGHLALFPSTLYHGTRPFPAAMRMTAPFDVVPAGDPK